jgi:hypothetical protein
LKQWSSVMVVRRPWGITSNAIPVRAPRKLTSVLARLRHDYSTRDTHEDRSAGIMDQVTIELLARHAGLDKALAEFREDVAAAAKLASGSVSKMKAPTDPRAEPWPPMRAGTGL